MEQTFNRRRINMISWLSYFFTGALVSTLGIVIGPVSEAFGKDPGFIGQMFTLMNIGLFLPIMVSGLLMRKFNLGKQLITGSTVSVLTCIALFLMPSITMFGIGVFLGVLVIDAIDLGAFEDRLAGHFRGAQRGRRVVRLQVAIHCVLHH